MSNCYVDFESLESLLVYNENLERLVLQENNIQDDSSKLFKKFLMKNNQLKHLDLSNNNLTKEFMKTFASGLKYAQNLLSLNLENNKIGSSGIFELGIKLNSSSLKTLNIGFNMVDKQGIKKFLELLIPTGLESLNISGNEFDLECLPQLEKWLNSREKGKNQINTSLGLADCGIDDVLALEVLRILSRLKNVTRLDLSSNLITEVYASEIMYLLKKNEGLKTLYLRRNRILKLTENKIMQIMKLKKKQKQRKEPLKYRLKVEQLNFEKNNIQNSNNIISRFQSQIIKVDEQIQTKNLDWERYLENEQIRRKTFQNKIIGEKDSLISKQIEYKKKQAEFIKFKKSLNREKQNLNIKFSNFNLCLNKFTEEEKLIEKNSGKLIRNTRKTISRKV